MKIKCPVCGTINYFSGLEEVNKFCSNCNSPLVEAKTPDTTENPYIKNKKEVFNTVFRGSKKTLDRKSFSNLLVGWVVESLKVGRKKGFYQNILKNIAEFGGDEVTEDKFYKEVIYFYMWLAYTNCLVVFQDKDIINSYFPIFTRKIYNLFSMFSKLEFGGCEEEEWEINLTKKINGYVDAYNLFLEGKGDPYCTSALGREFYKNLYGRERLNAIIIHFFVIFVFGELKASSEFLVKELTKYKI